MNKPSEPGWYLCDCGGKPNYIAGDLAMYFDGKNVLTSPMGPRCLLPLANFRRLVVAEEALSIAHQLIGSFVAATPSTVMQDKFVRGSMDEMRKFFAAEIPHSPASVRQIQAQTEQVRREGE